MFEKYFFGFRFASFAVVDQICLERLKGLDRKSSSDY